MENKEKKIKYYVRSNGEKVDISTMNTEHILNALGKKQREIFNCTDKEQASQMIQEINDLKEGYYSKLNDWYDKLGDDK
jgi:transcriptional accessory protein Tex/SPT6